MKFVFGILLLGFVVAFNSFGASTNPPPASAEQLRSELEAAQKVLSNGQEQTLGVSYEIVTNKLSALKLNTTAVGYSLPGRELAAGKFYIYLPETPQGDVSGTGTSILVTKIDAQNTRVQMKTIKLGLLFDSRDRQLEKQRMDELSQLLSAKN